MNQNTPPAPEALARQCGAQWSALCSFLEERYGVKPQAEYSACSMAPGWNVKFKKSGRALCTLYPDEGWFTCLVVVGPREAAAAELLLPGLPSSVQRLYREAKPFNGSRWLMLEIRDEAARSAAQALIGLRMAAKGAARK